MRSIVLISLLIFSLGYAGTRDAVIKKNRLNGTWVPVKQELGGTLLQNATFEHQKLIIGDTTYTVIAESVDKGVLRYNGDKMDIYGKEGVNAGKHFTAIYKLKNGELTICYNLLGDSYPAAFETKSKRLLFLSVFQKEQ